MPHAAQAFQVAMRELYSVHDSTPLLRVDTVLDATRISHDLVTQIESLRPFGIGFESPTFMLQNISFTVLPLGQTGEHIRWDSAGGLEIIGFRMAEFAPLFVGVSCDLIGTLKTRTWRDTTTVQFQVVDAVRC